LGASGLVVLQHVEAELAAALRIGPLSALRLMGDAVDLERRLPLTWAAAAEGRVECWVARKIVAATACLSTDGAHLVDEQVADVLATLPPGRLVTLVEGPGHAGRPGAGRAAGGRGRTVAWGVAGPGVRLRHRDSVRPR